MAIAKRTNIVIIDYPKTGAERLPFLLGPGSPRQIVSMHYARLSQCQSCKLHAPESQIIINPLKDMKLPTNTLLACHLQSLE
jgi:hypothetical protein